MPRATLLRHLLITALSLACSLDERELRPVSTDSGANGSGSSEATGGEAGNSTSDGGDGSSSSPDPAGGFSSGDQPADCGNGVIEGGEACDDGGASDRDGCDTACAIEPDYECRGAPSSCFRCSGAVGERRCLVPGGPFERGPDEERAFAGVAPFWLDELEVTVERFRGFVADFTGPPAADAGAHPNIAHSGWRDEWSESLPATGEALSSTLLCNQDWQTWTEEPSGREAFPITCVTYYAAFAFCVARGGRLPTEAEWEYAAAGGEQQRIYPWGDSPPNAELAQFGSLGASAAGTHPSGMSRFGQQDLAGSVWEWTLDYFAPYPASCASCAEVENGVERVLRGGDWLGDATFLTAGYRFHADPAATLANVGFRCAYDP